MEKIIIPNDIDLTEQGFKDLCHQIEIDNKTGIVVAIFCKKHGDQVGLKTKRFEYEPDMKIKVDAHHGDHTVILIDKSIIPVSGKLAEVVQEEKPSEEQLEELNSAA